MSLLAGVNAAQATAAPEKDVLGGGYAPLPSAIYEMDITLAYLIEATSGAVGLVLKLNNQEGKELRETVYITSGIKKGKKTTYTDKDNKEQPLPGFATANSLSLLTVGKNITDIVPEMKVIKAYNKEAGSEIPTNVEMLTELLGQKVYCGVLNQVVNKNALVDGKYVPTDESREQNEISKFFRIEDKLTVAEVSAQATEASFYAQWDDKHTGTVQDRFKPVTGAVNVAPTAAANSFNTAPVSPAGSLFAKPA